MNSAHYGYELLTIPLPSDADSNLNVVKFCCLISNISLQSDVLKELLYSFQPQYFFESFLNL